MLRRLGGCVAVLALGVSLAAPPATANPDARVAFSPDRYQASEHDGVVSLTVTRIGGLPTDKVWVRYRTIDQTATAGDDYRAAEGLLVFGPGEAVKTIEVAVIDDGRHEPSERFDVALSAENPSVTAGPDAVVVIGDDDPRPWRSPSTPASSGASPAGPAVRPDAPPQMEAADTGVPTAAATAAAHPRRSRRAVPRARPAVTELRLHPETGALELVPVAPTQQVDPALAALAALLLGRVAAILWFRRRVADVA